jgi:hypothetical protein
VVFKIKNPEAFVSGFFIYANQQANPSALLSDKYVSFSVAYNFLQNNQLPKKAYSFTNNKIP